jgi:hypothetical protein
MPTRPPATGARPRHRPQGAAPGQALPAFSAEQRADLLSLVKGADSVELKLSVPDSGLRSAVSALDMDPLEAQIRQVVFFDTPHLSLLELGIVLRARRIQRKPGDTVVKLRPVVPDALPAELRESPSFSVEVDAMPGGFVCSGSMKAEHDDAEIKDTLAGRKPLRKLFTKEQQAFFSANAPEGIQLDDLARLGPINVLKLKFMPAGFGRRLVAELWNYPDGSRVLELSTKCSPEEAFTVAAEAKVFLASRGIDLLAEQQTKTRSALDFFVRELATAADGSRGDS